MNKKFESGLKKRKKVLGEDYVNQSFENTNSFNKPFQEFLTETYWGGVWDRNEIDDKTKSIVTLSVLIALRAEHEIAIHTKGALTNGVTPDELMAILIHSSAYAGAPAAVSAEKIIRKTLEDSGNIL